MSAYRRSIVLAALLAVVVSSRRAVAQEQAFALAGDPVLEALIVEALEKNPDLRGARAAFAAATARIPQAAALPDPTVTVAYQNGGRGLRLGSDDFTFLGVTVSQTLPFPGKRRAAGDVEAKEAERAARPVALAEVKLVSRVRRAFTDLLLARENLRLIEDQSAAGRDIEELTRSRYTVGLAAQPDVLRAQAELARLDQKRIHEEGSETSTLAELNRLLGRPAGTPLPAKHRLASIAERPPAPPALEAVLARADERDPVIAEARAAVERSRAAVDFARRNLKPDFLLSSAYMNRGAMPAMWALNVGLVLPLYAGRKQRPAIAEAEERLRSDEAILEAVRLEVRSSGEKALAELSAAIREVDAFARGVLVVDGLAAESTLAGYKAGKVPFVSVLEAYNTLYRDRWQHAELLARVLWHGSALDELTGVTLPARTSNGAAPAGRAPGPAQQ